MGDVFGEVAELLFSGGADELVSKMNPTQSDLATSARKDRKQRQVTTALSATGAVAGGAGLAYAGRDIYRNLRHIAPKHVATKPKSAKAAIALAGLETAGLGGELMATKILHNDTTKGKAKLKQIKKDISDLPSVPTTRSLTLAAMSKPNRKKARGALKKLPVKVVTTNTVEKAEDGLVDVTWSGEISKANSDKQQIFGWASVVEVNGEPVVDLQGDHISAEEMEKAAYTYVQKSRKGGDMHLRDNWDPIQKSEMIESFIVTADKREAMGLPDSVPTGWWVGFQVQDPDIWAKVKSGERTGFSIHGRGKRTAL